MHTGATGPRGKLLLPLSNRIITILVGARFLTWVPQGHQSDLKVHEWEKHFLSSAIRAGVVCTRLIHHCACVDSTHLIGSWTDDDLQVNEDLYRVGICHCKLVQKQPKQTWGLYIFIVPACNLPLTAVSSVSMCHGRITRSQYSRYSSN